MIVKEEALLRPVSRITNALDCKDYGLWDWLEKELKESKVEGYGLTAIQIGQPIRAFIVRMPKLHLNIMNPKIISTNSPCIFEGEGCLSFPNRYIRTVRYRDIEVKWEDENGNQKQGEFTGMEAFVMQHEIDHLDGILFWDRRPKPTRRTSPKIGRNEPCPCKSGKKYKKCCGR